MAIETDPKPGEPKVEKKGEETPELDPTIAALMKDPDGIAALRKTKQDANAEAKGYRLKLEALEKAEKDRADAALKEQGKFKELAESAKAETEQSKARFQKALMTLTLENAALAAGCIDPKAAAKLADRAGLKVSDDMESVEGVAEAVAALIKSNPYLFPVKADPKGGPAARTSPPAPRGGFNPGPAQEGESVQDRITRGLEGKKK